MDNSNSGELHTETEAPTSGVSGGRTERLKKEDMFLGGRSSNPWKKTLPEAQRTQGIDSLT